MAAYSRHILKSNLPSPHVVARRVSAKLIEPILLRRHASVLHVVVQDVIPGHALLLHQVEEQNLHGIVLAVVEEDLRIMACLCNKSDMKSCFLSSSGQVLPHIHSAARERGEGLLLCRCSRLYNTLICQRRQHRTEQRTQSASVIH